MTDVCKCPCGSFVMSFSMLSCPKCCTQSVYELIDVCQLPMHRKPGSELKPFGYPVDITPLVMLSSLTVNRISFSWTRDVNRVIAAVIVMRTSDVGMPASGQQCPLSQKSSE